MVVVGGRADQFAPLVQQALDLPEDVRMVEADGGEADGTVGHVGSFMVVDSHLGRPARRAGSIPGPRFRS